VEGIGGTWRKEGGRCTEGGRRGGGKREKRGNLLSIEQYFAIGKIAKRRGLNTSGLNTPQPPPTPEYGQCRFSKGFVGRM